MGLIRELASVGRDLGAVFLLVGIATILPIIVGIYYQEWHVLPVMLVPTLLFFALAIFLRFLPKGDKPARNSLSIAATALVWVFVSSIGCIPFMITGMTFLDASFESMSAWTGTGFTFALNIEEWPRTLLFWRSFMQWIGGLGIIAFTLTVASRSGLITRGLYRSEGHSEAFMPSVIATAFQMWKIYFVLTIASILAIMATGLDLWDAVNVGFSAISTGGMSIYAAGISHFDNLGLELVLIPIMLAGALPFRLYYVLYTQGSLKNVLSDRILHLMIAVFLFVSAVLILDLCSSGLSVAEAAREGLFMAGTAISSTGFQNTTMAGWGAATILFLAVFVLIEGGTGSTSGGIKLDRIQVMFEAMIWWFRKTIVSPRAYIPMRHNGRSIASKEADMLIAKSLLLILLYIVMVVIVLIILLHDPYFSKDVVGTMYDVFSCVGNNGSTSGVFGPDMPEYAKVILYLAMWIGRLEIIPVIILVWGIFRRFEWHTGSGPSRK
ncbi:Trk system potassium uptake protein TrkG [Methanocorpusculaceae archaeon Sp1]|uniref:Trk system potassium uptake protein TrkG n=1 Tax=Methanorbis furvi TaxID=3028299 RepID=A0AAE4MCI9_9EURY|nr:Trk system potassium uptake protein TrkG [Methanocorpusculaceae archaeon Sp1]MDV0441013.1 Trk system potassium uptake protein TrkG [Methanocorpusculaceae archaeon Ag1]